MCVSRIESAAVWRITRPELCTQIHDNNMSQLSIRVSDELKDEFSNYCDHNGKSMSGVLKDYMREVTGESNHGPLPDDPELAKAYRKIWELRSEHNKVAVEDVEPEVANVLNVPKRAVRRRVFEKLDNRGYINVAVGTITANVDIDPADEQPDFGGSGRPEVPADD